MNNKTSSVALIALNVLASLACIAIAGKAVFVPMFAKYSFAEEYKEMMFACDNVMRDHLLAKHKVLEDASKDSIAHLEATELSLITCHNYDKLRKKMLVLGVTEDELAQIGLEKIEETSRGVREFVETHEFRF